MSWDVVIVGGGPAGLSAALHLVKLHPSWAGRIVVLEKVRHPRHKLCGGGLSATAWRVLEDLGIELDVPVFLCRAPRIALAGKSFSAPVPIRVVQRDAFDARLARACRQRGVEILEETAATAVHIGPDGVTISTSRGELEAKVVVGADGVTSGVRRALGLTDLDRPLANLLEVLVPVDSTRETLFLEESLLADFSISDKHRFGYYWEFPCWRYGKPFLNCGVFDNRYRRGHGFERIPSLAAVLRERMRESGRTIPEVQGHALRCFSKRATMSAHRALLVGDAAGVDPLFGEGLSYALFHGRKAALSLNRAFILDDFSFADFRPRFLASAVGRNLLWRCRIAEFLAERPRLLESGLGPWLLHFSNWILPASSLV